MIVRGSEMYFRSPFSDESEIEEVVKNYAEYLFGSSIIFLPKSKISTVGGVGTVPDGFVIDAESEEWFMVEAELANHGTWQHIAPQISKQLTATDSQATRESLLKICLELVKKDKTAASIFADLDIPPLEIHGKLQVKLAKPPTIAIPIDGIPPDLQSWVKTLKFPVKIWLIEKYQSPDGKTVFYSIPDENVPTLTTQTAKGEEISTLFNRLSQPYQDVLQSGLIKEGQTVFLDYGPRGKLKNQWKGILRKDGVEIDGKIMSLSSAAVYCIQQAGSPRLTANGWNMWKIEDGTYLSEFYNKVFSSRYQVEKTLIEQIDQGGYK
jgi:hypothetical protein